MKQRTLYILFFSSAVSVCAACFGMESECSEPPINDSLTAPLWWEDGGNDSSYGFFNSQNNSESSSHPPLDLETIKEGELTQALFSSLVRKNPAIKNYANYRDKTLRAVINSLVANKPFLLKDLKKAKKEKMISFSCIPDNIVQAYSQDIATHFLERLKHAYEYEQDVLLEIAKRLNDLKLIRDEEKYAVQMIKSKRNQDYSDKFLSTLTFRQLIPIALKHKKIKTKTQKIVRKVISTIRKKYPEDAQIIKGSLPRGTHCEFKHFSGKPLAFVAGNFWQTLSDLYPDITENMPENIKKELQKRLMDPQNIVPERLEDIDEVDEIDEEVCEAKISPMHPIELETLSHMSFQDLIDTNAQTSYAIQINSLLREVFTNFKVSRKDVFDEIPNAYSFSAIKPDIIKTHHTAITKKFTSALKKRGYALQVISEIAERLSSPEEFACVVEAEEYRASLHKRKILQKPSSRLVKQLSFLELIGFSRKLFEELPNSRTILSNVLREIFSVLQISMNSQIIQFSNAEGHIQGITARFWDVYCEQYGDLVKNTPETVKEEIKRRLIDPEQIVKEERSRKKK